MTTTEVSKKIRTRKATAETRSTFKFTQTKLEQSLFYKGNGKAPDKRDLMRAAKVYACLFTQTIK